ncbi:MAG: RHS repeat domain-containing protein [Gammaproteobacteria bacterium]
MRNFSYDPDGNLVNDGVHLNSFDALNRVSGIQDSGANAAVQFSYTPDGARYQEATSIGAASSTLTEVTGLFEVEATSTSTAYRESIVGGNGIVAIRSIQGNGILTTRYITRDPLGSVSEITNEVGSVIERMSYDAFGQRRNPTTWQPYSTVPNLTDLTDKGYTGQQQLDAVGLIHMNGRVYDPSIGRFISADPTIPDPFYSQAFNRYAYVYNNPLSATDPSGFGCTPTDLSDCPNAPNTTPIELCSVPCGAGNAVTNPGNTDIAQLGPIVVNAPIAPTNVPLPQSTAVTTTPTGTYTPSQISGVALLLSGLNNFSCFDPLSCGAAGDAATNMHSAEGWANWDGQVFGGALGDTGLQGPPKNADGAGGKGGGSPGRQPTPNQTKVPYHPAGGGRGPTVGTNPVPGSVGSTQPPGKPQPVFVFTSHIGVYGEVSVKVGPLTINLGVNLASYNTPLCGHTYWSHGISLMGQISSWELGLSWEQRSYNGGLSFQSQPNNFIFGNLHASANGVNFEVSPPQAFAGFTTGVDFPSSPASGGCN